MQLPSSDPDRPTIIGTYQIQDKTDFEEQTLAFNRISAETLTSFVNIVCYDQPIYEDVRVEQDEWLGLTLGVSKATVNTMVHPMYNQAAILIQDNDSKIIQ